MNCVMCFNKLTAYVYPNHTCYSCINKDCLNDDMPRYEITYNNYPTYLLSEIFMFDDYYINVSYKDKETAISKLVGCILLGTIRVPSIIKIDRKHPQNSLDRIRNLLVFS